MSRQEATGDTAPASLGTFPDRTCSRALGTLKMAGAVAGKPAQPPGYGQRFPDFLVVPGDPPGRMLHCAQLAWPSYLVTSWPHCPVTFPEPGVGVGDLEPTKELPRWKGLYRDRTPGRLMDTSDIDGFMSMPGSPTV